MRDGVLDATLSARGTAGVNGARCDDGWRRPACRSKRSRGPKVIVKARRYHVICVSIYDADLRALDEKVGSAKAGGVKRATRSRFIRAALARMSVDEFAKSGEP